MSPLGIPVAPGSFSSSLGVLLLVAVLLPGLAGGSVLLAMLLGRPMREATAVRVVAIGSGALAATAIVLTTSRLLQGTPVVVAWQSGAGPRFGLELDALAALALPWAAGWSAAVVSMARRYLHREPGMSRFLGLVGIFTTATAIVLLADGPATLGVGWEVMGLCSVGLIGFFHQRPEPLAAAIRMAGLNHIADIGLLIAIAVSSHGRATWASLGSSGSDSHGTALSLGIILAFSIKSAQWPWSSWPAQAMEGPTPSSALFYGALSIHAGIWLLLRSSAGLQAQGWPLAVIIVLGTLTALLGGRVAVQRADAKGAVAWATVTQVGWLAVLVGCGLYWVPAVAMLAHSGLRAWEILKAPGTLHDRLSDREALARAGMGRGVQRAALERFAAVVSAAAAGPDQRAIEWLARTSSYWVQASRRRWTRSVPPVATGHWHAVKEEDDL